MDITKCSMLKSEWLYSLQPKMEKVYQSEKKRPGVDCGSDHECLIAEFRLNLKEVGKTTRWFMYDLNYTVEVTNRFKGLDLIDECLKNYGWRFVTLYRGSRPSPRKKMQKDKMVVWGGLTNSSEKKRRERQRAKRKTYPLNAELQRIVRRDKKASLSD